VNIVRARLFPPPPPFLLRNAIVVIGTREGKRDRKNNVRCKQTANRKTAMTTTMAEKEKKYI
jgi:hypothetical protein